MTSPEPHANGESSGRDSWPIRACGLRHWGFCHIDGSTHDKPHEHGEGCIYTYPDCDDEQGPRHPGDELDPTARVGWPSAFDSIEEDRREFERRMP